MLAAYTGHTVQILGIIVFFLSLPWFGAIILLFYHSFWRRGYPRPPGHPLVPPSAPLDPLVPP